MISNPKALPWLLLAAAVIVSLYTHFMVFQEWTMPTYGNTFIHVASVRHAIEYGDYPRIDYSYGGGIPNLYVPFYRIFIANAALLTGLSIDFVSRMAVMLFALILPLAFYSLARRMFGVEAGLFAAFFASLPGELLIYSVRPLPQSLGMALLPIAFLAIYSEKTRVALFLSFSIALVHQEAAVFLAGVALGYFLLVMASFAATYLFGGWKAVNGAGGQLPDFFEQKRGARLAFYCFAVCAAAYLLWHFSVMNSFNIFELAQFKNHEGGIVSGESFFSKTGVVVIALSSLGLLLALRGMLRDFLAPFCVKEDWLEIGESTLVLALVSASAFFWLNGFSVSYTAAAAPYHGFNLWALSSFGVPYAFLNAGLAVLLGIVASVFVQASASRGALFEIPAFPHYFAFAIFFTGLFATQNHLVGIRVFMDRFLVYLQEPLVLLAALGAFSLCSFFQSANKPVSSQS
ncbi:MAG: hypothetical protein V1708_01625 [Candidatus Micrarchaeota archaeon]